MNLSTEQSLQAAEYEFPYHYLPMPNRGPMLTRHWGFAASYIAAQRLIAEWLEKLFAKDAGARPVRHVDIGCGDGALIHYLQAQFSSPNLILSGVDYDERAIKLAALFNPHLDIHCCPISELSGRDFDSASLVEVIEHIPPDELPSFMRDVAACLRPGGHLLVTVPSVVKRLQAKHYQHFDFQKLKSVLEPLFTVTKLYGFERDPLVCKIITRLTENAYWNIDAKILNKYKIWTLQRTFGKMRGCGRILAYAHRR